MFIWIRNQLRDLYLGLTTGSDGRFSHTTFWSSVGHCTATWIVVKMVLASTLTAEIFAIYLVTIAGHNAANKLIALKGASKPEPYSPYMPQRSPTRAPLPSTRTPKAFDDDLDQ